MAVEHIKILNLQIANSNEGGHTLGFASSSASNILVTITTRIVYNVMNVNLKHDLSYSLTNKPLLKCYYDEL